MFEIVVDTEKLRSQARILDNAAVRLNRISERISNLIAGVNPSEYDGLLKRKVQEILAEALHDSKNTSNELTHLRDELNEKAAAFDRVNEAAASALNTVTGLLDFSILTGAALSAYAWAGGLFGKLGEAIPSIYDHEGAEGNSTVIPEQTKPGPNEEKSAFGELIKEEVQPERTVLASRTEAEKAAKSLLPDGINIGDRVTDKNGGYLGECVSLAKQTGVKHAAGGGAELYLRFEHTDLASGLKADSIQPGDYIVYDGYFDGTEKTKYGHIAVYLGKDENGQPWVVEQNWPRGSGVSVRLATVNESMYFIKKDVLNN